MKVFIGGSKTVTELDSIVKERLKKFMQDGAEMLIGDCMGVDCAVQQFLFDNNYPRVTVYASNGIARNNIGDRPVRNIPVPSGIRKSYAFYQQKDIAMANDADFGFMVWDGKTHGTLTNMFYLTNDKKPVELHITGSDAIVTLRSTDELWAMKPSELPLDVLKNVLETFIPSEEMREFLLLVKPGKLTVSDIISGSPAPLELKAEWMKRLSEYDELFANQHEHIQKALDELKLRDREVFLMNGVCRGEHSLVKHEKVKNPYLRFYDVLDDVYEDLDDWGWNGLSLEIRTGDDHDVKYTEDDMFVWYELQKWSPDENNRLQAGYKYYLIGDIIVGFDVPGGRYEAMNMRSLERIHDVPYPFSGSRDLKLPIPYKTGDILTVDTRPFAPVKNVVLLENVVGHDTCYNQVAFLNQNGLIQTHALKYIPAPDSPISPLYRLRRQTGALSDDEAPLKIISEAISGNDESGRKLLDYICRNMGEKYAVPFDELRAEFIDKLNK